MQKQLVLRSLSIFASAALVAGATFAFFSDTETSSGNVLAAGAIDLKIDNESYLNGVLQNGEGGTANTTWVLSDLTNQLFFDFTDLKPGDEGEDTISLHVDNNDAWLCMDFGVTADDDVTLTEPEEEDGDTGEGEWAGGELDDALNFVFWADDGDNVLEDDEDDTIIAEGVASEVLNGTHTLADSEDNFLSDNPETEVVEPVTGAETHHVGKAWCYGELTKAAVTQDGETDDGPDGLRGSGVACDGTELNDTTQTDKLKATLAFRAVQARNNEEFLCATPIT